jgi:hypothetical protein
MYSAKRYERLLKAHDISTNNSPRKAAGAGRNNADSDSLDGSEASPKTPVSKKRKRAGGASASRAASTVKHDDDEEDETPVKKERAVKKERVPKKEESDEDAKVKGEDDGSFKPGLRDPDAGDIAMRDIPEAFPRRGQDDDQTRDADDTGKDDCVVVGERSVPVSVLVPATFPAPVACSNGFACAHHVASGTPSQLPPPTRVFGNLDPFHCRGANVGFPPQVMTSTRCSPASELGTGDATPSSLDQRQWSTPPNLGNPF